MRIDNIKRNSFELDARNLEQTYNKLSRPTWDHTIKTYQGNGSKVDWPMIAGAMFIVGLGLVALVTVI